MTLAIFQYTTLYMRLRDRVGTRSKLGVGIMPHAPSNLRSLKRQCSWLDFCLCSDAYLRLYHYICSARCLECNYNIISFCRKRIATEQQPHQLNIWRSNHPDSELLYNHSLCASFTATTPWVRRLFPSNQISAQRRCPVLKRFNVAHSLRGRS